MEHLTPALFNIKELEQKHIPILEKINKLIRNEIPIIFDIKQINNGPNEQQIIAKSYNKKNTYIPTITDNFIIDNEYKLFYTHSTYGEFFVIKTEYLHTMSNLGHKAHTYKNLITLEEIIYSCSLTNIFWKNHKINYDVREYKLIQSNTNNKTFADIPPLSTIHSPLTSTKALYPAITTSLTPPAISEG